MTEVKNEMRLYVLVYFSELLSGIALGYGLDDGGLSPCRGCEFFSSPPRPDELWGLPSLLFSGYQELFPWG
jgi:hypothetical protein